MIDRYAQRRAHVLDQLGPGQAMLLAAAAELFVGRDTELRYAIDADVYYLTGYTEPDAVLLLDPQSAAPFTMFVRARDPDRELWTGSRAGVDGALQLGADAAFPIAELPQRLIPLLAGVDTVFGRPNSRADYDALLPQVFAHGRRTRARTGIGPHILRDPGDIIDPMRLIKDAAEIELLRTAARVSAESFAETLPRVRAGMGEWQVEALIEYGFRSRGASGPAFPSIVASGGNATILHYVHNDRTVQAGELLLIDAGARYRMYCGDITRTVPVSGRFTARQREVYDVVLDAHDAALAAVVPGAAVDAVHAAARRVLLEGLNSLGLLPKTEPANDDALKRFYPHRTSHWLGLDVHDVGAYASAQEPVRLEPGMVLTIEPGLYLADEGVGIRIEDDVLVTERGAEVLTAALPTAATEIEALLR